MSFFTSLFKAVSTIVKPIIFKPLAKLACAVAPLLSKAIPSMKIPVFTEAEAIKWLDTKSNNIGKFIADFPIGGKKLSETGFGKFVTKAAKVVDDLVDVVDNVIPVNKLIETGSKLLADYVVKPVVDFIVDGAESLIVSTIDSIKSNSKKIDSTVALATEIDVNNVNIPDLTNLNAETATKQVSTSDKQSLEKVSEILNNKNDSSFDYQKVAKIADSSSLSSSVKGQLNSNLGYNQYEKMQDLVSNKEQVSRYQEIEQQAIENKILDQQPSEEQVINHQISELQYQ